jgi:hypothetical protein
MNRDWYLRCEWEQVLHALKLFSSFKQRSTGVLVGRCVFHQEKTPSLHFYPDSKRFHCYGCGVDGDMVEFVVEYQGFYLYSGAYFEGLKRFFQNLPTIVAPGQLQLQFGGPAM